MRKLTWRINGSLPADVARDQAAATFQRACDAWQKAGGGELQFMRDASQVHPADIHFEFGRIRYGAEVSARRGMMRQGGGARHIISFSDRVTWNAGGPWNRVFGKGHDLLTHALRQLGCVLGMEDSERETSVMQQDPKRFGRKSKPDKEDAAELRALLLRNDAQSWRE
jgi:hypothetical protein